MAAGVLFFNQRGELLIIKPSYKDHLSIPGGVAELDESPVDAAVRETKEEIGLKVARQKLKLLTIEYASRRPNGLGDSLQFVFSGGLLGLKEIQNIVSHLERQKNQKMVSGIEQPEVSEYKFVKAEDAPLLFSEWSRPRIVASLKALKNKRFPIYLENGKEI